MAQSITLPVKGLYVDPNPILMGSAGRGALCRADEIIFNRQGSATSRPALRTRDAVDMADRPRTAYPWEDGVFSTYDGSDWKLFQKDGTEITGDVAPPEPTITPLQFIESRRSLYLTSSAGMRKLLPGETATAKTGLSVIPWFFFGFGLPGGDLGDGASNYRAAYRYCIVSRDVNDYVRRSAPSPRLDLSQSGAPAVGYGISGRFYFDEDAQEGDTIEVYRTKISIPETITPSEEYYLAFVITLSAADIAQGFTDALDNVQDASLGVALYTNPSEGGIQSGNEVPPLARCAASFENCAWYGNSEHRHRINNEFINAPESAEVSDWTKLGCGLTMGSEFVTGVASVSNLRPGMAIAAFITGSGAVGDGWWGEGSTWLSPDTLLVGWTGVGPYVLEMSKPALATATKDLSFADVVTVTRGAEVTNFYWTDSIHLFALFPVGFDLRVFGAATSSDYEARMEACSRAFTYVVNAYYWNNQADFKIKANFTAAYSTFGSAGGGRGASGKFFLESVDFGGDEYTFTSNRPDFFKTPLGDGQVSDPTRRPNRLYYSKPFEPEAVPLINYIEVGSEKDAIRALVSTGSVLYVFKDDGVFRVTGFAPSSWRVDLISPNHRILYGSAACALNGSAVAWTNQGVVAFADMQIHPLSEGRINTLLRPLEPFLDSAHIGAQNYQNNAWVEYWPTKDLLLVGYNNRRATSETPPDSQPAIYVMHVGSREWSKWTCDLWCATAQDDGTLLAAWRESDYFDIRTSSNELSGHDAVHEPATWTLSNVLLTLTAAQRAGFVPRVGDWIYFSTAVGTTWRRITSAQKIGTTYFISFATLAGSVVFGDVTYIAIYETITTKLQWQTHGLVGKASLFRELLPLYTWSTASERGQVAMTAGAASDLLSTLFTVENTNMDARLVRSRLDRFGVLRGVARSTHFYPYVETGEPSALWAFHGITVEFESSSEKMRR